MILREFTWPIMTYCFKGTLSQSIFTYKRVCVFLTFLAVMFVFMQNEATSALTTVAAKGVHTFMLTSAVLLRALIFICENKTPDLSKTLQY